MIARSASRFIAPGLRAAVARVRLGSMLSRIIVAALLIASAIFAAVRIYWPDIIAQPPSAAAFLGALAGAGGGLLAIILGALINAELNRRRDNRLRETERQTVATEVQVELAALRLHARNRYVKVRKWRARAGTVTATKMGLFGIPRQIFLESNAGRLGLLGPQLTFDIVTAHAQASHIAVNLEAIRHGDPGAIVFDPALAGFETDFNLLVRYCGRAIDALEPTTGEGFTMVSTPDEN